MRSKEELVDWAESVIRSGHDLFDYSDWSRNLLSGNITFEELEWLRDNCTVHLHISPRHPYQGLG